MAAPASIETVSVQQSTAAELPGNVTTFQLACPFLIKVGLGFVFLIHLAEPEVRSGLYNLLND
jgi:hypothetical protein